VAEIGSALRAANVELAWRVFARFGYPLAAWSSRVVLPRPFTTHAQYDTVDGVVLSEVHEGFTFARLAITLSMDRETLTHRLIEHGIGAADGRVAFGLYRHAVHASHSLVRRVED